MLGFVVFQISIGLLKKTHWLQLHLECRQPRSHHLRVPHLDQHQSSSPLPASCLHHAQQQSGYSQDHAFSVMNRASDRCLVGEDRSMAHQECKALQTNWSRFALPNESVALLHQRACLTHGSRSNSPIRHFLRSLNDHRLLSRWDVRSFALVPLVSILRQSSRHC